MSNIDSFLADIGKGQPSTDEYVRSMHLCFKNAEALLRDAETLRNAGSPRALSLGILALEEIGKILLLCEAAARAKDKPGFWDNLKKRVFTSHRHKQSLIAAYGSALLDKMSKDGKHYYDTEIPAGAIPLLDRFKQWSFYVDFVNGHFLPPQEFVDENAEWTEWVIAAATERLESIRPMHDTEELSVWVARTAGAMITMLENSESAEEIVQRFSEVVKEFPNPNHPLQPTTDSEHGRKR